MFRFGENFAVTRSHLRSFEFTLLSRVGRVQVPIIFNKYHSPTLLKNNYVAHFICHRIISHIAAEILKIKQEAQLSQRGRAMPRVVEYFG